MSRSRTLLVTGLVTLLAAPAAVAAVPADFVGIESPETLSYVYSGDTDAARANIAAQGAIGIHIHRQQFNWDSMLQPNGKLDFSKHDAYVGQMAAAGLRVLPVLFDAPKAQTAGKDNPAGGIFGRPKSGKALGQFGVAVIKRYGPKGSFWKANPDIPKLPIRSYQIWNEPNLRYYWGDRPNAKQYVAVLKGAYQVMKKADKKAEIVTAGIPDSTTRRSIPLRKYLAQMYKAGAKKWFDTMGFNAYAANSKDLSNKIKLIRSRMAKAGDKRAKLWITEIGWADKGKKSGAGKYLVKGAKGQASEITKAIALMKKQRKKRNLRGFIYFQWQDPAQSNRAGLSIDIWGFHAGLRKKDGSPKPAYKAFKVAVAKL